MKQLTIFDVQEKMMTRMTWLDLYNYLHQKANDIKNLDSELWSQQVVAHNAETGDEHPLDTWLISKDSDTQPNRLVLVYNDFNWDQE